MNINKSEILKKNCYTELGYGRINRKQKLDFSNEKIKELISAIITETNKGNFKK